MKKLSEINQSSPWQVVQNHPFQREAKEVVHFVNGSESLNAALIAQYFFTNAQNLLIISASQKEVEILAEDLRTWVGEERVWVLPDHGLGPYENAEIPVRFLEERMELFDQLLGGGDSAIYLGTVEKVLEKFPDPVAFLKNHLELKVGQEYELDGITNWLYENGYREDSMVENTGYFSLRGGILDVYPLNSPHPVRLDFFGDELEQIRYFDVFSQRSLENLSEVVLRCFGELNFTAEEFEKGEEVLKSLFPDEGERVVNGVEKRKRFHNKQGLWWQKSAYSSKDVTLLDLLPQSTYFVCMDQAALEKRWQTQRELLLEYYPVDLQKNLHLSVDRILADWDVFQRAMNQSLRIYFDRSPLGGGRTVLLDHKVQERGSLNLTEFAQRVESLGGSGVKSWVLCSSPGQVNRLKTVLQDLAIEGVLLGGIHSGFVLESEGVAFFTDHQLFNQMGRRKSHRKSQGRAIALTDFRSLERGDHVLHRDYGVGEFAGISRIDTGVGKTDCFLIKFAGRDQLSLPISDLHKLEKYVGKEGVAPSLDKLGGKKWENLKAKVRKKVVEIAKELVELYAKRELKKGFSFPPDDESQKEFEEAFPYQPTPDQVQAIQDCKFDMENRRPMDRLVCGDVGFGKTEVAMRCAFKAVNAGKQVAVLVPTTILAQQHFENFVDRFSSWPIRIESLSRYKSPKQKKEVFGKLKMGGIDIVVGTHAMLGKQLEFKSLGLFIIDEEQKFGVKQKERLRQIRLNVDTLAMSATPIPRTLHLSLSGVRDISTISTPPRNRLPVETRVLEFQKPQLQKAIQEELERGGQVFVVNDFIRGLDELAELIHEWVPQARLAIAHGQLAEKELERVFSAFTHREYDVLLCTNIVESGIDIPSVNTIIIHNAQNFGMSQLYQLRGRVGRGELKAHAYLVYPKGKKLSEDSKKRLESMEMFTDLGSGFKLAMRDLEIRGAGNLLGTEQSGFIAEIGYETYIRMVKEAVDELRGGRVETQVETKMEIDADAFIPESYIEDGLQRLNFYQRLSKSTHLTEILQLQEEIVDRYGKKPKPVEALFGLLLLRMFGRHFGFGQITQISKSKLKMTYGPKVVLTKQSMEFLIKHSKLSLQFSYADPVEVVMDFQGKGFETAVENGRFLLEKHLSLQS